MICLLEHTFYFHCSFASWKSSSHYLAMTTSGGVLSPSHGETPSTHIVHGERVQGQLSRSSVRLKSISPPSGEVKERVHNSSEGRQWSTGLTGCCCRSLQHAPPWITGTHMNDYKGWCDSIHVAQVFGIILEWNELFVLVSWSSSVSPSKCLVIPSVAPLHVFFPSASFSPSFSLPMDHPLNISGAFEQSGNQ